MRRNDLSQPPERPEFRNVWSNDLDAAPLASDWLWHGYLAPGAVTLLTSPWKSGKTTLVSVLLNRLGGGGELAGLAVRPAKAAIVSEESVAQWRLRKQKFGFGPHICWICRPFRGRPRPEDWLALLDHLLDLRREHGIELAVIDPLAEFLPAKSESEAGGVLDALLPLQRLTNAGLSVLLLHHPRKHGRPDSRWARGSGALSGFVDILIEMDYHANAAEGGSDRCRQVTAYSRFDDTPRYRLIELTEAGTEYRCLGDREEAAFAGGWPAVRALLDAATKKLTREEIRQHWPAEQPAPPPQTLWRWLDRAVSAGLVSHDGDGHRHSPYRYWTKRLEEKWQAEPMLRVQAEDEEVLRRFGMRAD